MDGSDSAQSLLGKKFAAAKSGWFADAADFFVLLCSFLLTTASIVLVALIFHAQPTSFGDPSVPSGTLSLLQRAISTLSTIITSAVIMVAGKRYVLFKLTRGGIRSRRVAVYSRPSIGNLARYLVWHGLELPLLALLAVWALGLATGLTVNDAWAMAPVVQSTQLSVPYGPYNATIDPETSTESIIALAAEQLDYVMASVCSGVAGTGVINITGDAQLASMGPMGPLFYPPLPDTPLNIDFSLSTWLNGVNISAEPLSSIPPTAKNFTCTASGAELWYESGDNQMLSIISTTPVVSTSLYRFNTTPIILGGTLQSTGNTTEFVLNGTTGPNVMSDDGWAQGITNLVCNAVFPSTGACQTATPLSGGNLLDFAIQFGLGSDTADLPPSTKVEILWSTVLGMAMGAYSSASWPKTGTYAPAVPVTYNDQLQFTPRYGVYVLIANIVVSAIMLVVVVKLGMAKRLGGDFMDATRLLLDPLKNPELFNVSLDTTVDALANPYMLVREGSEFLLAEQASKKKTRRRRTSL